MTHEPSTLQITRRWRGSRRRVACGAALVPVQPSCSCAPVRHPAKPSITHTPRQEVSCRWSLGGGAAAHRSVCRPAAAVSTGHPWLSPLPPPRSTWKWYGLVPSGADQSGPSMPAPRCMYSSASASRFLACRRLPTQTGPNPTAATSAATRSRRSAGPARVVRQKESVQVWVRVERIGQGWRRRPSCRAPAYTLQHRHTQHSQACLQT